MIGASLLVFSVLLRWLDSPLRSPDPELPNVNQLGILVVGAGASTVLATFTYEESLQRKNLERVVWDHVRASV